MADKRGPASAGAMMGAKGAAGDGEEGNGSGNGSVEVNETLWRLDEATRAELRRMWPDIGPRMDGFLKELYTFMGRFPDNAPHLSDQGKVDCLKLLQKEHWQVFFSGRFDDDYCQRVMRQGLAHARVRLAGKYYIAGYSQFLELLVRRVIEANRRDPARAATQASALIRTVLMEVELVSGVFYHKTNTDDMQVQMQLLAEQFEHELDQAVEFVRRAALGMEEAAGAVVQAAGQVASDGEEASHASEDADRNAQSIAAAAEEMSASIAEISRQVEHSTLAARDAADGSKAARDLAERLAQVSQRIGSIVQLIERIAKDTRLLALNANIEAARAGNAGRGFAVVATEVKNLADQTNRATGEIRSEIQGMQDVITRTVDAIGLASARVDVTTGDIAGISGAVTEQEAVMREIAQSAASAASSISTVHSRIASLAAEAENSSRESDKLRASSHGMVEQVVGIKRRVIATLRSSRFADRRREPRVAVDLPVVVQAAGRSHDCRLNDLSLGGAQVYAPGVAGKALTESAAVTLRLDHFGEIRGAVVFVETDALHVRFADLESGTKGRIADYLGRCGREDDELIALAKDTAYRIGQRVELGLTNREISWDNMWDNDYRLIHNSDPPQYSTRFLSFLDQVLPEIQEAVLPRNPRIVFCAAVDRNGYLPVHNKKYSHPQRPGEKEWNTANCRNRRIFDDRTGLQAARSRLPVLVQTYRRDMGGGKTITMKDISAPVMINGQHWGGFRIGATLVNT